MADVICVALWSLCGIWNRFAWTIRPDVEALMHCERHLLNIWPEEKQKVCDFNIA